MCLRTDSLTSRSHTSRRASQTASLCPSTTAKRGACQTPMQSLRGAGNAVHPSAKDHNAGQRIGTCPIVCWTFRGRNGITMARMRGDGTWAMSLEVWSKLSTPATRSQSECALGTRTMPHHAWQAPDPLTVTTTPHVARLVGCTLPRPRLPILQRARDRMIRHWIKRMLLVLLVLMQTACPQYATKQPDEVNMPIPGDHDGSDSG